MILRTVKAFSALGEQGPHFLQKLARIHENREMPTLDRHKSLLRCDDAVDKSPPDAGGRREVLGPLEDSCVRANLITREEQRRRAPHAGWPIFVLQ
jgi:hypothetical protein